MSQNTPHNIIKQKNKIGTKLRNTNLLLFLIASSIMIALVFVIMNGITDDVSQDYAGLYSTRAVGILNTHLNKEITLMDKVANSRAMVDWLGDENDEEKRQAAFDEMTGTLGVLESEYFYIGFGGSLHEYTINLGDGIEKLVPIPGAVLVMGEAEDAWYFNCVESQFPFELNVDIGKVEGVKRVWLNHQIKDSDGKVIGALATGLSFEGVLKELFGVDEYAGKQSVRTIIIDQSGIIQMDSALELDQILDYENEVTYIKDQFKNATFESELNDYLTAATGIYTENKTPEIIKMKSGDYRYASIAPISGTRWSVVSFYSSSTFFSFSNLWPVFVVIIGLYIIYLLATSYMSRRLMVVPINRLVESLSTKGSNISDSVPIAGVEREDEFGTLARTLTNLFDEIEAYNARLIDATEKAKAASNSKSVFLASMSHEIRTPINAITGMTHLGRKADDPARKDYCLERIDAASSHLLGVINDILDISKIEADKFELSFIWFDLEKALQNAAAVVALRMVEKGIDFSMQIDPALPAEIDGDDQRFSQVLTNFLSNAAKFTPEGGRVKMSAVLVDETDNNYKIRISVEDTGIGISPETKALLFQPFVQAESGISRKYGGTGLGLAISKSIVNRVGGVIGVESVVGEGSTFFFEFSAVGRINNKIDKEQPDDAFNDSEDGCFIGKRILLAEDVEINREIFCSILENTGVEIDCAENGQIALNMFAAEPEKYDLVIMDLQMPEMDGHTAARAIRALDTPHAKDVPIIAMTANVFKEDIEKSLESGMNDHLGKPIDYALLMQKLKAYLLK